MANEKKQKCVGKNYVRMNELYNDAQMKIYLHFKCDKCSMHSYPINKWDATSVSAAIFKFPENKRALRRRLRNNKIHIKFIVMLHEQ